MVMWKTSDTKGDFLILDTGEVFEVIKLWK